MAQAAHELTEPWSATLGSKRERSTDTGTGVDVVATTDSAVVPSAGAEVAPGERVAPMPCSAVPDGPAATGGAAARKAPQHSEAITATAAFRRARKRLVAMQ